jgi:hypothetical protein
MKTLSLTALAIVLGIALGVGTAVLRIKHSPWNPNRAEIAETKKGPTKSEPGKGPAPKVVVDQLEYSFGTVDIAASGGSHDFTISNKGEAPLILSEGGTSCRCTVSKLANEKIAPGESTKVTLTWKAIDNPGHYQQSAKILTNDPAQPSITLIVGGEVTTPLRFSPSELVFSRLSAGEVSTAQSRLFCYLDKPVKIVSQKWSDEATAKFFSMTQNPLTPEEIKNEPKAKSGELITVTVKPGLTQGVVHQKLIFETDDKKTLTLPILGNIGSEIAVVGPGWDTDKNILMIGEVPRDTGAKRRMMLVVRGPLRKDIKFSTYSVSPDILKVTFGERSEINNGAVIQIPLFIEIPAGCAPANHLGSEQGRLGEIILETTHPSVPKLRILVRFAVEG